VNKTRTVQHGRDYTRIHNIKQLYAFIGHRRAL